MRKLFVGQQVRATSRYAFRQGEWADLLAETTKQQQTGESEERQLWFVQFPDGVTDMWVANDPAAEYEFREKEDGPTYDTVREQISNIIGTVTEQYLNEGEEDAAIDKILKVFGVEPVTPRRVKYRVTVDVEMDFSKRPPSRDDMLTLMALEGTRVTECHHVQYIGKVVTK